MSENLTLAQQIDADLKTAMLARDETAKLTLRSVKTALSAAKSQATGLGDTVGGSVVR